VSLTPDQVSFYVSVTADPSNSLDQIVAALSGLGITASNFSGMYGANDNRGSLQWSFTLATPLTKITATIASLIALQQSIVKNNSGMLLTFQVQGAYVSPQAFQSQPCSAQDLAADAQAQAQTVAAAAGMAIGPIVALSNPSSGALGQVALSGTFASVISGTGVPGLVQAILTTPRSSPFNCSLEVKFKLLRY
jgi:NO-binding membrane sensor protein with MHYT domain